MAFGCAIAARTTATSLRSHRGIGALRWWPLETVATGRGSAVDVHARLVKEFIGVADSALWITTNQNLLLEYLTETRRMRFQEVACHVSFRLRQRQSEPSWLGTLRSRAQWLGIDVAYCTGSESFVADGYESGLPDLTSFLSERLNPNGLFDEVETARKYLAEYQRCVDEGHELELLDEDVVLVHLWEDRDAVILEEVIGPAKR